MGVHGAVMNGPGDDRILVFVSVVSFPPGLPKTRWSCAHRYASRRLGPTHAACRIINDDDEEEENEEEEFIINQSINSKASVLSTRPAQAVRLRFISCLFSVLCCLLSVTYPRLCLCLVSRLSFSAPAPCFSLSAFLVAHSVPVPVSIIVIDIDIITCIFAPSSPPSFRSRPPITSHHITHRHHPSCHPSPCPHLFHHSNWYFVPA